PGADIGKTALGEIVVRPRFSASLLAENVALKALRGKEPFVQGGTADAEGIFQALIRPRAEAVERKRERIDAKLGHDVNLRARAPPVPRDATDAADEAPSARSGLRFGATPARLRRLPL